MLGKRGPHLKIEESVLEKGPTNLEIEEGVTAFSSARDSDPVTVSLRSTLEA